MARLWSTGFELGSFSTIEFDTKAGTASNTDNVVLESGTYSQKVDCTISSGTSYFQQTFSASDLDGPIYIRFKFYIATSTPGTQMISICGSNGGGGVYFQLTSADKLQLMYRNTTPSIVQIGSDSSAISKNTWHYVELKYDRTGGAGATIISARIDGVDFAGATNLTQFAGINSVFFGSNLNGDNRGTAVFYFDSIGVNNSSGSFQNTYLGDGSIIHLRPSAAGDNNQLGSASSTNYQQVDEVTPDDSTTTINTVSDAAGEIDDYNIDDTPAAIGASDTINCVAVGIRYSGGSTSSVDTLVLRVKASSGGTVEESSGITPNSTSYLTNANASPKNYPFTLYDLPGASTTSWTKSTLDTAQIGVKKSADSTFGAIISAIWLLVDYTPSVGGATVAVLRMMMGLGT